MTALETSLTRTHPRAPVHARHPDHVPRCWAARRGEPALLTWARALAAGQARITEVSEQGSVPELRVVNGASQPLLLLDGEELWAPSRTAS